MTASAQQQKESDKDIPRRPSPWTVATVICAPIFSFWLVYAFSPGYIIPTLNHPGARLVCLALIAWHILGSLLFARTANSMMRKLIVLFFTVPLALFPQVAAPFLVPLTYLGPLIGQ